MAYQKLDENGVYRNVNPKTGQFMDDEYPIASSLGQVEHQTVATNMGNIIDHDEETISIVDENGLMVLPEDEAKLKEFIKESISVDNFVATFNDNAREALLKLLALQDNKHPLKKGGIGIAYRTDAIIMHCRMAFSSEENIVFDAILGMISSFPENKSYTIAPAEFLKYTRFEDDKTIYRAFKRGCEGLQNKHLVFDDLGPDKNDSIVVPWFNVLRHHKGSNNSQAYIEFAPSDFFRSLALCSQIVHGAYGSLEVTSQLSGKYTIALYWYLEGKKNYKAYPTAREGVFEISTEDLKYQFMIPDNYKAGDIERRVLAPAKESINDCNECDFTWDYVPVKEGRAIHGYKITINKKNYIEAAVVKEIDVDPFEDQIKTFLGLTGVDFTDEEITQIYNLAKKYERDASFIMQAAGVLKTRLDNNSMAKIENPFAYLLTLIKNGTLLDIAKADKQYEKVKNNFNNFEQRNYDMKELEKILLAK